jgi:formylglycine-generating enzyme required for sulfatase activity
MPFEAGDLGAARHIPQSDRAVTRARGEAAVGQHAQRIGRLGVPFEAAGLGAARHIPQPNRPVKRARGEATVGQHAHRMGRGFAQAGAHPAVCLNWNDAKAYADWLAGKTGKTYRLVTEAEWEYAARARTEPGTYPRYSFGNDEEDLCRYGNGADQSTKSLPGTKDWTFAPCNDGYVYTSPVGSFAENGFGLYDMQGNAWQWTADCWHDSYAGAPSAGTAWTAGDCGRRVARGGSWYNFPPGLRAAFRGWNPPDFRGIGLGFRLARTFNP